MYTYIYIWMRWIRINTHTYVCAVYLYSLIYKHSYIYNTYTCVIGRPVTPVNLCPAMTWCCWIVEDSTLTAPPVRTYTYCVVRIHIALLSSYINIHNSSYTHIRICICYRCDPDLPHRHPLRLPGTVRCSVERHPC